MILHFKKILLFTTVLLSINTFAAQDSNAAKQNTQNNANTQTIPEDNLNRRTPRGTVEGFLQAISKEDYKKAANYLNVTNIPDDEKGSNRILITKSLKKLLDKGGSLDASSLISNDMTGNVEDKLDKNSEKIGTLQINDETLDILLEKLKDKSGHPIWLFSSKTLSTIPLHTSDTNNANVDSFIPEYLNKNKINGSSVGHWVAIIFVALVSIIGALLLTIVISKILRYALKERLTNKQIRLIKAFFVPLRLWVAVTIFLFLSQNIGISILIRQYFSSITIMLYWMAFLILLWQVTNFVFLLAENKMSKKRNISALSALEFCRRSIKFFLIAAAIIVILKLNDYDVTSWLAAIGIGGIAIALGAQKTIENIVGSISLLVDQPIRVGDFCQVGETMGTIEQIGIRSTRIRTLSRTVVTIPNGEFSSQQIENYTHRDNFWYHKKLGLRYETSQDQLRYLLVEIRSILYAHPKINNKPNRVRFIDFAADSLTIEVYAYVMAVDHEEFLEVQEDINLRIMGIVEESGSGFAFPSQTVYLTRDKGLHESKTQNTHSTVRNWKENKELQNPKFTKSKIDTIINTIEYPPEYSAKDLVE